MLGRTTTSDELMVVNEEDYETVSIFDYKDMSGEMRYSFTETDDGTSVRMHGEFEPPTSLFERAVQPVVNRYMNRQFRASLQTMKELIEAEYAAESQDVAQA